MKLCIALSILTLSSLSVFAQVSPLPPSSNADGIALRSFASRPDQANWTASGLADYRLSSDNGFTTPAAGHSDVYGRAWTSAAPDLSGLTTHGGTLRAIFLGASNIQAFGYTYASSPAASSYTLVSSDESSTPASVSFGDYADVTLAIHDLDTFDFWQSTARGAYTLFSPEHRLAPALQRSEVLWTDAPLLVSTFIPALGGNANVDTWIATVREFDSENSPTEFRFAIQEFQRSGNTLALDINTTAVPEPTTYALAGALACGLLILRRRRARRT